MTPIRLWWHCLLGMFRGCQMCWTASAGTRFRFCSCGYMHPEGKSWDAIVRECAAQVAIQNFNRCACKPFSVSDSRTLGTFRCDHCGVLWGYAP
jgi:hypothetical protein